MKTIKSILFYPLMWLRKPFLICGKLLGALFFIGGIIVFLGREGQDGATSAYLQMFGLSFFFFILNIFYDQILLKLNPTDTVLILNQ